MTEPKQAAENNEYLDENSLIAMRRQKLTALRESQIAYPNDFAPKDQAAALHQAYDQYDKATLETLWPETEKPTFCLAGRLMAKRIMGKASFLQLQDHSGQLQLYIQQNQLGAEIYQAVSHYDLGDIVGVEGTLFKTKTQELTLNCQTVRLLVKALRPLPEKFHGLTDQEQRYRQRYVDLIVNPEVKTLFRLRSLITQYIRQFFLNLNFLEVETPMLHPIPGGATARPFITHHQALDLPLYLRIAPELYLKRLIVGGLERVFEINRSFRNEGISTRHNPEFTMIEFYQAYATEKTLMQEIEMLFKGLIELVSKEGQAIPAHWDGAFRTLTMREAIVLTHNELTEHLDDSKALQDFLQGRGIRTTATDIPGLQLQIFEETVESTLLTPTFITEYPSAVSPLSRRNDARPELADRFELFIGGREIANGFAELNDPEDQAERFRKQAEAKAQGDAEAMFYDADYIRALEYAMPPTAGAGIGIDRLVMWLTGRNSIREVLLFPLLRPESE